MRRAAAFPPASSVGVARSPRVGVPSNPGVVSGGWWVCAGVIRMASDACFGDACWRVRPRESCGVRWGWGGPGPPCRGMPFLGVGRGVCRGAVFLYASVPAPALSWFLDGYLPPCCVSSGALSLWVPALTWGPFVPSCLSCPCCPLPSPCPCPSPSWCGGGGVGRGCRWPSPRGGWPGAIGGGLGGCRGGEALDPIPEEGLPCRLRHDCLGGGLVGVSGGASAHLLEGVHHVQPFSPFRSPGPLHPAEELLQSGGRPLGEVSGGPGGGGGGGPCSGSWSGGGRRWTCGIRGGGGAWGSGSGGGRGWGWRTGTGRGGNGRGRWTLGGGGALDGAWGSGSGGGGGWGWWMGMGGGGNREPGGASGRKGRWTWGGGGVRGGTGGSGSGGGRGLGRGWCTAGGARGRWTWGGGGARGGPQGSVSGGSGVPGVLMAPGGARAARVGC